MQSKASSGAPSETCRCFDWTGRDFLMLLGEGCVIRRQEGGGRREGITMGVERG
jgi:hypothetical protein